MDGLLLLSCGSLFALAVIVLLTAWAFRGAAFRRWSVRETAAVVLTRVGAFIAFLFAMIVTRLKR